MLSIFVMYSTDRQNALDYTLACLRDMRLYSECQKTLVVDGKIDVVPVDWEVVQVPRLHGQFCWSRMWDAGVYSAKYEKIVYLDSDRLLPKHYLESVAEHVEDNMFLYTSEHFQMLRELPLEDCKALLECRDIESLISNPLSLGAVRYERRAGEPQHGPGKNVMSGSTAFTKRTYISLGGVDPWYCGHGAYADSDFHMTAAVNGCRFVNLGMIELHFPHAKREGKKALSDQELWRLGVDNFIYYCQKWKLPKALAESMAVRSGIHRPARYVEDRLKAIKADAKES